MSFRALIPVILALAMSLSCVAQSGADLATLKTRVREDVLSSRGTSASRVEEWRTTQQANGSWPDINYSDKSRTGWQPADHLRRLVQMAVAYLTPGTTEHQDVAVRQGISNGVNYWYSSDPVSDSWFQNDIAAPRELGVLLLLMQDELTSSQVTTGTGKLAAGPSMTGQNRVWLSSITIYRALLENNLTRATSGMNGVKSVIDITTGEGIQPDFSFHQHGAQLYSGGYGHVLVLDVVRWISLAANTGFAFSPAKEKIMADLILEGTGWMLYHKIIDHSTTGRNISRMSGTSKGLDLLNSLEQMAELGGPSEQAFGVLAAHVQELGPGFSGNRHFWRSDFTVHRRADYYTSVKLSSNRTFGTESINNENLKGIHLAFGTQFIYRRGDEYIGIFPVWNWLRLPGTTIEQTATVPGFSGSLKGTTDFVGGVSNGVNGLTALHLDFRGVRGRKSWFFFDDGFVALGAGIACSTANPVFTTLNQTRLTGPVLGGDHQSSTAIAGGERTLTDTSWIHHDNIGYVLPNKPALYLKNAPQSGSWKSINSQFSADIETMDVFTLGIDHGSTPVAASYEYAVLPGATPEEVSAYAADNPVTVISNTPVLQAARHRVKQLAAASFYQPGKLHLRPGLQVTVDQPCLALLQEGATAYEISVSNPLNTPLTVRMHVSAHFADGAGATWLPTQKMSEIIFQLPGGGGSAGSTVKKLLPLVPQPPTHLPSAAMLVSSLQGFAPSAVDFDGRASFARGTATLASYHWDFGDGTTSDTAVASHSYTTPGIYQAVLTVTDSRGATDTASAVIHVRNSLVAAADSYVRGGGFANTNYGNDINLRVKNGAQDDIKRRIYLKFDLNGYSGTITRAVLRLEISNVEASLTPPATAEFSVMHVPDDGWTESGLTWNNRPTRTPGALATAQVGQAGQIMELDLTTTVRQEYQSDKILSLQVDQLAGNTLLAIASKEHPTALAPALLIETAGGDVVANAGSGGSLTLPQNNFTLNGSVSAPGQATVLWSQQSGPGSARFNAPADPASRVVFSRPGTYVLRLHATDGLVFSHSDVTVTVLPESSASWAAFWLGDPAADLTLDSDNDGLPDALEFALGGNPLVPDAAQIQPRMQITETPNRQFTLHYHKGAEGATYEVEWSTTLGGDWSSSGMSAETFDDDRGTYSRGIAAPPATPALFLRLKVTLGAQ